MSTKISKYKPRKEVRNMEELLVFNSMNRFVENEEDEISSWVDLTILEIIEDEIKDYCKEHNVKITYFAVGVVNGCLSVTCILQTEKEDLLVGKYQVYTYNLDNPELSKFEECMINKQWDWEFYRED